MTDEVKDEINKLKLMIQTLEARIKVLEDGESSTGIYFDGCSEATVKYIQTESKRNEGEK